MKKIGPVENGADTVLDALMEYMKNGLLIVCLLYTSRLKKLPFCRKNPFRQTGEDGEAGEGPQCGTNVFASGGVHI